MTTEHESSRRRLARLTEAISNDLPIDWDRERGDSPALQQPLTRLQQLEALGRAHRAIADNFESGGHPQEGLFHWGPFLALEKVGEGGFGEVYRALDTRLQREVALKLRRMASDEGDSANLRFLAEAQNLARVRHSNVLVVHGVDVHDGRAGLWTDFIRGQTLAQRVMENGPVSPAEAARIGVTLCRALAVVHAAGLVHGDVKASNVMREDGGRILLMDFGSVSRPQGVSWESSPTTFGTPLVLAPEVLRGESPSSSADVYSLGVLLYQLVSARFPVPAQTWAELLRRHERGERVPLRDHSIAIDPDFAGVIERALDPEPLARFPSIGEMEQALVASMPSAIDPGDRRRSLRSLLKELGEVPAEMCRQIGLEAARALVRAGRAGAIIGPVSLDHLWLRPDGTVELSDGGIAEPTSSGGGSSGEPWSEEHQVRVLCAALFEFATGHPASSELGDPTGRSMGEESLAVSSSFFEEFVRCVAAGTDPPPARTGRELVQIFLEGESSAWWIDRRRARRAASRPSVPRLRVARETALHGRATELAQLRTAFDSVQGGRGCVVLLEGEAGIGKTRLVDEAMRALDASGRDLDFLFGSYPPGGAATAVGAFLSAYREHLGGERLEGALAHHLSRAPLLIPPFAALLRGQSLGTGPHVLTKESLQTAFVQVTQSLADDRATVVLIDDLHFAPEEGLSLFAALALAVAEHRVLLIGATRPGLSANWLADLERYEHCLRITLPRLSPEDVAHVLAEALGSNHLAESLTPELVTRSDGNPLFLFENLRALEGARRVQRTEDGRWMLAGSPRDFPIPSSIEHLIQARFAGLSEEDQELLDVACCGGFEFDPLLVGAAVGLDGLHALRRFALIEKHHRLIRASGRSYVFDHHQVQEALYRGLFPLLREQYHALIATTLESTAAALAKDPGELDGTVAVMLCEQFLRGRRGAEGLRYLGRALDHLGTVRPAAASLLMQQTMALPGVVTGNDRFLLCERLVAQLFLTGRVNEELSVLDEALALADQLGDPRARARSRRMLGFFHSRSGRADEARAMLTEAARLARDGDDAQEEIRIALTLGGLVLNSGRQVEALAIYEEALELARRVPDRLLEAQVLGSIGVAEMGLRRLRDAEQHLQASLAITRTHGSQLGAMLAVGNLGALLLEAERPAEAMPYLEEHLKIAREAGIRLGETYASGNLAELALNLGRSAQALAGFEQALSIAREIRYRLPEAENLERIGGLFAMLGRWQDATANYQRCLAVSQEIQNARVEGFALMGMGSVAEQSGELTEAGRCFEQADRRWGTLGSNFDRAWLLLRQGVLFRGMNRADEARLALEQAVHLGKQFQSSRIEVLARAHLTVLTGTSGGETEHLFRDLEARLPLPARLEARFLLWQARHERSHLEEARRLLRFLCDHAPAADRDTMVERVPLYRAILAEPATH